MVRESKGILVNFISTVQQNVGEISHLDCVCDNLVPALHVPRSQKYSPLPGGLENKEVYICGDFNIDLLKTEKQSHN